jgi:hypothetical protein
VFNLYSLCISTHNNRLVNTGERSSPFQDLILRSLLLLRNSKGTNAEGPLVMQMYLGMKAEKLSLGNATVKIKFFKFRELML